MSEDITFNFNDNTAKTYKISVNWQSDESANIKYMEGFYDQISFMLEKIAADSGHIVSDIQSFSNNDSTCKIENWEMILLENPQPRNIFFNELAVDNISFMLGIDSNGFGCNNVVDLAGALSFEVID